MNKTYLDEINAIDSEYSYNTDDTQVDDSEYSYNTDDTQVDDSEYSYNTEVCGTYLDDFKAIDAAFLDGFDDWGY